MDWLQDPDPSSNESERSADARAKRVRLAAQLEIIAAAYLFLLLLAVVGGACIFGGRGGPVVDPYQEAVVGTPAQQGGARR